MFCLVCVYSPICVWDEYLFSMPMGILYVYAQELAYCVGIMLRGFHAECSSVCMDCIHGPSGHARTRAYSLTCASYMHPHSYTDIPIHVQHAPCILVCKAHRRRKLSMMGAQRVVRRNLYGKKLHFYGVIVKAGGHMPPCPPGSIAYGASYMHNGRPYIKASVHCCMHI